MLLGHLLGDVGGPAELLRRLDDMVGGHHDHDRLRILPGDQRGAQPDARGRVAAHRFADDAVGGQGRQLLGGFGLVQRGGDDPGAVGRHLGLIQRTGRRAFFTHEPERPLLLPVVFPIASQINRS